MSKYSDIAIHAARALHNKTQLSPQEAWCKSACIFYPDSPSSREKGCPKSAFLGLCEEGLIKGVKPGSYTRSKDNKQYALEAIEYLKISPNLTEKELWDRISPKKYNQQMHVVKALFQSGYINI